MDENEKNISEIMQILEEMDKKREEKQKQGVSPALFAILDFLNNEHN